MSELNVKLELPSNNLKYGNGAVFTGLKMKHFKHLAMFSDSTISMATRLECALEVISDVVIIDGLKNYQDLLGVDFDFIMLNMKILGTPQQRSFKFMWTCECIDKDSRTGLAYSNDALIDLAQLMAGMKVYDGETFFVKEYEFSFVSVSDWIKVYRIIEKMVKEMKQRHEAEVVSLLQEKGIDETAEEVRYDYEKRRILRKLVAFDEMNALIEYRIAAHLQTKTSITLDDKKKIVDNMDLDSRADLLKVVDNIGAYGVKGVVKQKCKNCGLEVPVRLPFRKSFKFV